MRNSTRLALSALIAIGTAASAASGATAATTIGSIAPPGESQDCFATTLYVQAASAGPSYVVPAGGGVITAWSVHGNGYPAEMTLKIARETTPGTYLIKGSSRQRTVAPSGTSTFGARIPVTGGDEIGLWTRGPKAPCNYVTPNPGDQFAYLHGSSEPAIGSLYGPVDQRTPKFRINVSAGLEPDADGDGFGDETQDRCPADPKRQEACSDRVAPRTRITRAPKRTITTEKRRAEVRFAFRSSEASKFSCALDGRRWRACTSPFTAKVRKGRHTFRVAATDAAGNADASPAKAVFEVKRKR